METKSVPITVLIPVGPKPIYKEYLPEAIESVLQQQVKPQEILIIDDQANLDLSIESDIEINIIKTVWLSGFAHAFNQGVAQAKYDAVLYLASDDKLKSNCIEEVWNCYQANNYKDAWYALTYELDTGEVCSIPINAALITRGLWNLTGGFPPSAFAGPDALMLSIIITHLPDRLIKVCPDVPLYWIRSHADQETHCTASFFLDEMNSIRNKETLRWTPRSLSV